MLIWNPGRPFSSGVIEVDVKGLRPNQPGGYNPGRSKNRGYFISLCNKPGGDKGAGYNHSAFIEALLNIGYGYSAFAWDRRAIAWKHLYGSTSTRGATTTRAGHGRTGRPDLQQSQGQGPVDWWCAPR